MQRLHTLHCFFRCRQLLHACLRFATEAGIVSFCMFALNQLYRRDAQCFRADKEGIYMGGKKSSRQPWRAEFRWDTSGFKSDLSRI
jgi:hypothetical protein